MWSEFRGAFPTFRDTTYLNTCSLGALSSASREAVTTFLDQWERLGASAWYELWLGEVERLREGVARLLGCGSHEVALFPNVSSAVAAIASSIDYEERPHVVCADLDFPTVAYQWHARERDGARVRLASSPDGMGVPESAWRELVDDSTALLATGHVFFTTGWRQDVARLSDAAHDAGALLLLDAYQSAGIIPLHVRESGVDMVVGGGLKWLLGGPGIAFLYVREGLHGRLDPRTTGWFAVQEPFGFDPARRALRTDARRFEGGTPSPAAVFAARAGLDLVHSIGVEALGERTLALVALLAEKARESGLAVRMPEDPERRSGIVVLPDPDPHAAVAALASEGIVVDARPTGVRVSPYAYNTEEEIERFVAALRRVREARS